jgi:hypothetical protein
LSVAAPASAGHGPFTATAVVAMVVVGAIAAAAFLGLSAVAPALRAPGAGAHALSRSAVGFAGAVRLLNDSGVPVMVSRGELPKGVNDAALLVLTPSIGNVSPGGGEVDAVVRRHTGPTLIVLPKWIAVEDPGRRGWVRRIGQLDAGPLKGLLPPDLSVDLAVAQGASRPVLQAGASPAFAEGTRLSFGPVQNLQAAKATTAVPALLDPAGRVVLAETKARQVYVLTDPDLLNNKGLASWETARSAVAMIDALRGYRAPVVFDVSLLGYKRSRDLMATLVEPPFLAATLCGLFAAVLMGLHAAVRFGPLARPERAFALGKRTLADNSAALIGLARRRPRMARRYAALTRAEAARALGAPRDLEPEALDALLDRMGAARAEAPFSELAAEAERAGTDAELMQAASKLYRWRVEMTREPG